MDKVVVQDTYNFYLDESKRLGCSLDDKHFWFEQLVNIITSYHGKHLTTIVLCEMNDRIFHWYDALVYYMSPRDICGNIMKFDWNNLITPITGFLDLSIESNVRFDIDPTFKNWFCLIK
jgi:hypothetical protein